MQVGTPPSGRAALSELFQRRPLDDLDDLEGSWAKAFKETEDVLGTHTGEAQVKALQTWIAGDINRRTTVATGLIYGILTKPPLSKSYLQALLASGEDQLPAVVALCQRLLSSLAGPRLLVGPVLQIVCMVDQLIKAQVPGLDPIVLALLRLLPAGDVSKAGCRIATELFNMLSAQRAWLLQPANTQLLCAAAYAALSLLATHAKYGATPGVQAEVQFLQHVLRPQLRTCSTTVGRDFVRLLYAVCTLHKVAEMQEFWDLLVHPTTGTVDAALARPTPPQFLRLRLTVEVETKLLFIFHRVPYRQLRRYQSWFQQRYLGTAEQQQLLPDLIRYTCGAFHPTNEMLANRDLVPRWQMIGWWLKSAEGHRELQWQCEQAALWDWATYNVLRRPHPPDSLMNLEPAMLVMYQSLPKHPEVTSLLLSHLFAMMDHGLLPAPFVPQSSGPEGPRPITPAEVVDAVRGAMDLMVGKVVRDLGHIYKCPRLDQRLRDIFVQHFRKQISIDNEALAARQQRQSPSGLAPSPAVVTPPATIKLEGGSVMDSRRGKAESDSESDTDARHRQRGRMPPPSVGRSRSPSPAEGDSSDSDSDSEHRMPATPNGALAALEPHISTFAAQAAAVLASRPSPGSSLSLPSESTAESPVKRARRALEGLLGRYLRTDSPPLAGDLALWLFAQLAPDLRAVAGDSELVAQQAFDSAALPFLLLDTVLAYLVAADPAATAHDSRRSAAHEHVAKRFASHRLPKLQVEGKMYQLLLSLENLDPLFATRWLAVCLVHDGVVEAVSPNQGSSWLLVNSGTVPALPTPSLVEPLHHYEGYCSHRMQVNADLVQQSLATPSLSAGLPPPTTPRLDMGAVINSDLLHAADQSKALLLAVLPAVFRFMYSPRRASSPNSLLGMLLEQDWLWLEDTYCLRLMLGGGIRLLADTEGSLLQLVEASLAWSPVSQRVLWDVLVHQARCIAGSRFAAPAHPPDASLAARTALFTSEGAIDPGAVTAFVSGVLDLKGLDPLVHRQPLAGLLALDLGLLLRSKGADAAVAALCTRLLRLSPSFGAFPAAMLLSLFGIRHQEGTVVSSVLDVLGDLLQRAQVPDPAYGPAAECRLLVRGAVDHLLRAVSGHEEGLRLLHSLMGDKSRPLSALLKGLRARDLIPATTHQQILDLASLRDVQAPQREAPAAVHPEQEARRVRRRLKRLRRGAEDDAAGGSDDGDDDDVADGGGGGLKRRRKVAVAKKED
eukprot:EG_transcript_845